MAYRAPPSKKITNQPLPADIPKERQLHFDLPIALSAAGRDRHILPPGTRLAELTALGGLALDGGLVPVLGGSARRMAARRGRTANLNLSLALQGGGPPGSAPLPASSRRALAGRGHRPTSPGAARFRVPWRRRWRDQRRPRHGRGQGPGTCQRALENRRRRPPSNLLMVGAPGSGQIHAGGTPAGPPAAADRAEALETSMVQFPSRGLMDEGGNLRRIPSPSASAPTRASMPPSSAGAAPPSPARSCLAHNGVLFMDEFPECHPAGCWKPCASPIRDAGRWSSPAPTAMSAIPAVPADRRGPTPAAAATLAERRPRLRPGGPPCGEEYLGRISGSLMDRFDLRVEGAARPHGPNLGHARTGERSESSPPASPPARALSPSGSEGLDKVASNCRRLGRASRIHRAAGCRRTGAFWPARPSAWA